MSRWDSVQVGFWLVQYTLGIVDAEQVARKLLKDYRGTPSASLKQRCRLWFESYVQPHISRLGSERVAQHLACGHKVVLATSAVRHSAQPLAQSLAIPHIVCSELEENADILTGDFCPPLCYGQGKLERAKQLVKTLGAELEQVAFYTDSITDIPLLQSVGLPVAINPDFRLRRHATRQGWRIENWKQAISQ